MKSAIWKKLPLEGERVRHHARGRPGRSRRPAAAVEAATSVGDGRTGFRWCWGRFAGGGAASAAFRRAPVRRSGTQTPARSAIRFTWTSSEAVSSSAGNGLAEHDQLLVVDRGTRSRASSACVDFGPVLRERGLPASRPAPSSLVASLALRAQQRGPRRRSRAAATTSIATIRPFVDFIVAFISAAFRAFGFRGARFGSRSSRGFGGRRHGSPSASSAGGTGAASKATTMLELGDEVAGLAVLAPPSESLAARRHAAPSSSSASSEDSTPTRVTPSMSLSAVTKPATASWPWRSR